MHNTEPWIPLFVLSNTTYNSKSCLLNMGEIGGSEINWYLQFNFSSFNWCSLESWKQFNSYDSNHKYLLVVDCFWCKQINSWPVGMQNSKIGSSPLGNLLKSKPIHLGPLKLSLIRQTAREPSLYISEVEKIGSFDMF